MTGAVGDTQSPIRDTNRVKAPELSPIGECCNALTCGNADPRFVHIT